MIRKILVFVAWLCLAIPAGAGAIYGWSSAISPPGYMQDAYVWRIIGACIIGTLFPGFVIVGLLTAQIYWWWSK
jgi:hypothetical protein